MNKTNYYSGSVIEGKVKLNVGPPITYEHGVFIRFRGKEHVEASLYESTEKIRGESVIVSKASPIVEQKDEEDMVISPGRYSWKFRISLPDVLPPSFVSSFGYIRYLLYVLLDSGKEHYFSIPITIHSLPSLDLPPKDLKSRCMFENKYHHVRLFGRINSWLFNLNYDRKIHLHVEIDNDSSHDLAKLKIKFLERRIAYGQFSEPYRSTLIIAARTIYNPCLGRGGR